MMKNQTELETELRKAMGELELLRQLRRTGSRRYDILMSRAQTLAYCLGQRSNLDYSDALGRERVVPGATIAGIRTVLRLVGAL